MDSWLSYLQKAKSNTLRTVVLNFHDCNYLDNCCRGDLDHLQHMPHTQNNKACQKVASLFSKHALNGPKNHHKGKRM